VEQPDRFGGDQRRLLGGLGEHRIARGQCRRDLAGEDGEREVPGADADKGAAAAQLQLIDLADRPVEHGRGVELLLGEVRIVAAEVDRLAHLGDAVVERSCRPHAPDSATSRSMSAFQRGAHGAQDLAAREAAPCVPGGLGSGGRDRQRGRCPPESSMTRCRAPAQRSTGLVTGCAPGTGRQRAADDRARNDAAVGQRLGDAARGQAIAGHAVVAAERVLARLAIDVGGQRDARMRAGLGGDRRDRITDDILHRHPLVEQAWTKLLLAPFSSRRRTR
jgi:hypothetical protein